jgi:hypothetical protein
MSKRRLLHWLRGIAIALALIHVWANRYDMNPDAISYLDIGDNYVKGDWHHALNAYWSPLYSWILGVALRVVRPSMQWEFPLVHAMAFVHFLLALAAFEYFLRGLQRAREPMRETPDASFAQANDESWPWLVIGYTLFVWSSLRLVTLDVLSPDMLVTALVYVAAGILVRARLGDTRKRRFVLLGLVLGVAYLSKAAMFPIGFAFVVAAGLAVGQRRPGAARSLIALVVFLAVASPFITAISVSKGRFTFSDAGRLAYTWFVDGRTNSTNWQGEPKGTGVPAHPTRVLRATPTVYEYATPVAGTWPPWYDASYWNEGVKPRVQIGPQVWIVVQNLAKYATTFAAIIATLLVVGVMTGRSAIPGLRSMLYLIVPSAAGLALYALVLVEGRYVAAFIVVLTMAALAGMLPHETARVAPRLLPSLAVALAVALLLPSIDLTYDESSHVLRALAGRDDRNETAISAMSMRKLGLRPGDAVGRIGTGFYDYWARLARVRIIAEVPDSDVGQFWAADSATQQEVLQAFARAGAKAVVAQSVPEWVDTSGWLCVDGEADYVVRFVAPDSSRAP